MYCDADLHLAIFRLLWVRKPFECVSARPILCVGGTNANDDFKMQLDVKANAMLLLFAQRWRDAGEKQSHFIFKLVWGEWPWCGCILHHEDTFHLPSGRLSWLLIRLKGPKSMCGLIDGHIIIKLDWINQMTTVNGLLFIVMHFWPVNKFVFVLFNASFSVHENNLLPSNACVRLKSIMKRNRTENYNCNRIECLLSSWIWFQSRHFSFNGRKFRKRKVFTNVNGCN